MLGDNMHNVRAMIEKANTSDFRAIKRRMVPPEGYVLSGSAAARHLFTVSLQKLVVGRHLWQTITVCYVAIYCN